MKNETKVYSDFIKRNKVVVMGNFFVYNIIAKPIIVPLEKSNDGKWSAGDDDRCFTKKAAIYFYLMNRLNVVNGIIQ